MKKVIFMTTIQLTLLTTPNISKACWGFCGDGFRVLPENNDDVNNAVNDTVEKAKDVYQDTVTFGQHGRDRDAQRSQLEMQRAQQQQESELRAQSIIRQEDMQKLNIYKDTILGYRRNLENQEDLNEKLTQIKDTYQLMTVSFEEAKSNLYRIQMNNNSYAELLRSVKEDVESLSEHFGPKVRLASENDSENDRENFIFYKTLIRKSQRYNVSSAKYISLVLASLCNSNSSYNNLLEKMQLEINYAINSSEESINFTRKKIAENMNNYYNLHVKVYGRAPNLF